MSINHLPSEILEDIISFALPLHPSPASILQTCSTFNDIGTKQLYTRLGFYSLTQLDRFLYTFAGDQNVGEMGSTSSISSSSTRQSWTRPIPYRPRTVEFSFINDVKAQLFFKMHSLFLMYLRLNPGDDGGESPQVLQVHPKLELDALHLKCYSHTRDGNLEMIRLALGLVNPTKFIWTGPDPPHHFSIAIVAQAVPHLFQALHGFTNLQELKLTHIELSNWPKAVGLPITPSTRRVYIGQATHVSPTMVASGVLLAGNAPAFQLEQVRLVDAYKESIWGPRVRRSDILAAALNVARQSVIQVLGVMGEGGDHARDRSDGSLDEDAIEELVRQRTLCQAKSGRINGGECVTLPSDLV
ncbi:hypothetical protein CC1G_10313 [Coprinopsis cinerea okayama7|uniref:F-box domain-containing protein n=1 Tax=Coprinopsis cinerea (strain Okayama-7 / 130 / ATCC MYA-4618 / FGSC 9003) TaxID=240176 RepID=A8P0H7_COPC7|nr:hypothetical protein CC1G_10313 [Coprinopsis cinerea okayama7\|eukprot:XP_001837892.2 hypothetical protein CC1G_10313 [Coprinopsis cinerea okayama7\